MDDQERHGELKLEAYDPETGLLSVRVKPPYHLQEIILRLDQVGEGVPVGDGESVVLQYLWHLTAVTETTP